MSREGAVLIMVAVAALILGLMFWGWRRRAARDGALEAVHDVPRDLREIARFSGLYVATTAHDEPLNRLAVRSLRFRSRASILVFDEGVVLEMPGERPVFLAREAIRHYGAATWTIDRVVETDGLSVISWKIADDAIADTYLRLQDAAPHDLFAALDEMSASTTTGVA